MIRKQWLESVYDLGPHPFLRVGALSDQCQFSIRIARLSFFVVGQVNQLLPKDKVLSRGNERTQPYFYTSWPTSSLTSSQSPVCPCLLLWFPCPPFSSFFLSFLPFHTYRQAMVTPLSAVHQHCPIKKVIWGSLIIPCRTGGPLI